MPELAAAITAGGRIDGPFAARIGTDVKALAPWRGRTLVDAALDAARAAGATRVAVVGGAAGLDHCAANADEGVAEARHAAKPTCATRSRRRARTRSCF